VPLLVARRTATTRFRCRLLAAGLLLGGLSSCGGPRPPLPLHAGESRAPRVARDIVKSPEETTATLEATTDREAIVAALARITTARAAALLGEIAIPRHHRAAPEGLRKVAARIEGLLGERFSVSRRPVSYDGAEADIVVGERLGRDPSRIVVVMAHYDAVAGTEGADDDASGVVGLLLVAEALARLPTEATVRFVTFPFEEQGMIGSTAYVESLTAPQRDAIVGAFNLEMIGYSDHAAGSQRYPRGVEALVSGQRGPLPTTGDFIGAVGCPSDAAPLEVLGAARTFVPRLRTELIGVPRALTLLSPDLLRSDHGPFWFAGIPAVMLSDTADFRSPHYHRASDRIATIDRDLLVRTAQWVAAGVSLLAVPVPPTGAAP
jgi:aminopeptidase YwaD